MKSYSSLKFQKELLNEAIEFINKNIGGRKKLTPDQEKEIRDTRMCLPGKRWISYFPVLSGGEVNSSPSIESSDTAPGTTNRAI